MNKALEILKLSIETLAETSASIDEAPKKSKKQWKWNIAVSGRKIKKWFRDTKARVKQEKGAETQQLITQQQQMMKAFIQNQQPQQQQMGAVLGRLLDKY